MTSSITELAVDPASTSNNHRPNHSKTSSRHHVVRLLTALTVALALVTGLGAQAHAAPPATSTIAAAPASVGQCEWWQCTAYFSKSETQALGSWGPVPQVPWWWPWQAKVAYWGGVYGLKWFASQYASRGMCSAYRVSLVPWASQGYAGYYCNWN